MARPENIGGIPVGKVAAMKEPHSMLIYGLPKRGKASSIHEPVLTVKGWRPIGELIVGDRVRGTDGELHTVTGVYPQGIQPLFRVTCDDHTSTLVVGPHLWSLSDRARVPASFGLSDPYTTDELNMALDSGLGGAVRLILPELQPMKYEPADLPIDPYVLGLLIGDGALSQGNVIFGKPWEAAHQIIANRTGTVRVDATYGGRCLISRYSGGTLKRDIAALGLSTTSVHKFIPPAYLTASIDQRFYLLQGLLDTDGSFESNKTVFNTSSARLRDDVMELVRSLGGCATYQTRLAPKYSYKGETRTGQPAYRVNLRLLPEFGCPFVHPEKVKRWLNGTVKRLPSKRIVSIEPEGEGEAVCIMVNAPDSLYITRDWIVTHNTTLACSILDVEGFDNVLLLDAEEGAGAAAFEFEDVDHVPITSGVEWDTIMDELASNKNGIADHYDAVIVDTLSTIQRWVTDEVAGGKKPQFEDWASTYDFMMKGMWTMHRMKPLGITLVHTLTREDKVTEAIWTKPWVQGSSADTIGNVPDLMGYLDVRAAAGGKLNRTLQLQPKETMIVGNRYEKILPTTMINPTMSDIYATIRGAGISE